MNLRIVYDLAIVLTRSQIRGTQRGKTLARIFGEPRIILGVDAALLLGVGLAGFLVLTHAPSFIRETVNNFVPSALAGAPVGIAFAVVVFGMLYEISQPIQSLSTDIVNWLPISPLEYVAGSTLSESYVYSFMLSLILGILLGPSLFLGMGVVWLATAVMATFALAIGACVVEMLDSLTNRISSSFYKKSGRSGMFFRLALTVIILVFVQLIFSGQIVGYLLRSVVQTVEVAWFVPLMWPSVAVLGASQGNVYTFVAFASLSALFTVAVFLAAAEFRARFWVPIPVSIRLSPTTYRPSGRNLKIPGIGTDELAIVRKDFRSLTRRREMARFLAIPFVLAVSFGISFVPLGNQPTPDPLGLMVMIVLYLIPVSIFVGILSMTSIGQEGYAVWNLYAAPISPGRLLRAKMLYAALLGLTFSVGMLIVFSYLVKELSAYFLVVLPLGIVVVFEEAAIGICYGARFPDFREMVRSRYVSVWASIMGTFTALFAAGSTASPIILSLALYGSVQPEFMATSFIIFAVIFIFSLRIAKGQIRALLQNIRT